MDSNIWVCSKCGGENVQALAFVRANGRRFVEFYQNQELEENIFDYCDDCDDYIPMVRKDVYETILEELENVDVIIDKGKTVWKRG